MNNKKDKKVLLTDLAIILFLIKTLYHVSKIFYVEEIENIFLILACFVTLVCLIYMKFTYIQYFSIMIVTGVLFFTSYSSNDFSLLITFFTILLIKNKSIDDFIRIIFKIKVYFLVLHIIVFFLTTNIGSLNYYSSDFRVSFLTSHPNIFSLIYAWTILEWIWLNWEKVKKRNFLIILIMDVIIYSYTKTDVFIIIHIITIIIFYFQKYIHRTLVFLAQWIAPIMITFTFYAAWAYSNSFGFINSIILKIDSLLSRRIAFISLALKEYNFTMFGQVIDVNLGWNVEYRVNNIALDNVFALFIFKYGAIYMFILCYSFWKLSRCKNAKINIFIIIFTLYGIIEGQLMIIYYSFVLGLLKYILFNQIHLIRGKVNDT